MFCESDKWAATMQKLLGVQLDKVFTIWMIFGLKICLIPLGLIFGVVFFDRTTAEPGLPPAMISSSVLEILFTLFIFYLYVYTPYTKASSPPFLLHLLFLL